MITESFERATFRVEAVRVTTQNMVLVAEWCGGRIVQNDGRKHIQVPSGLRNEHIAHAYIGTWVSCLAGTTSFRVYKEKSFTEAFRPIMSRDEKFAKVHEILLRLRLAQDRATYHGDSSGDVILLIEKMTHEICEMI